MVKSSSARLDAVFHALSDPTRRRIVATLAKGPRTVGQISRPFPISLAAVSKHVKVLERARIVRRHVRGREHECSLDPAGLVVAREWIAFHERFWNERLDALETMLEGSGGRRPDEAEEDTGE